MTGSEDDAHRGGPAHDRLAGRHILMVAARAGRSTERALVPTGAHVAQHLTTSGATTSLLETGPPPDGEPNLGRELRAMGVTLRRALRPPVPDVVIGIAPNIGGTAAARRIADRFGAAFVVLISERSRERALPAALRPSRGLLTRRLARLEADPLRLADAVVVTSPAVRTVVAGLGVPDRRIELVPEDPEGTPEWRGTLDTLLYAMVPQTPPPAPGAPSRRPR